MGKVEFNSIQEIDHRIGSLRDEPGDLLVVPAEKGFRQLPPGVEAAIEARPVRAALELGDFKGEAGELLLVYGTGPAFPRTLIVGMGDPKAADREKLRSVSAAAARKARDLGTKRVTFALPFPEGPAETPGDQLALAAEGALLGTYQFPAFKTADKEKFKSLERLCFVLPPGKPAKAAVAALARAKIRAEAVNFARNLANTPSNHLTPSILAQVAAEVASEKRLEVVVMERDQCETLGMGAFLSVARGSDEPPKFITLKYDCGVKDAPTIGLVGKAITFDAGGISLKPSAKMDEMKFDMCGGAAVLGVMRSLRDLDLKVHVVAAIPATENLPSGRATKPGDVVTSYLGKTVEILNTDAEGRLILADALSWVIKNHHPAAVIDIATLTGAVIIALGHYGAAVLSNDDDLAGRIQRSSASSGDRTWRLPIWEEFPDHMRGETADLKNIGDGNAGGGTIAGGTFLKEFVGDTPWAHVDIAGTAWWDKDRPHLPKGASGFGVRLILDLLEGYSR